jgi:hypothetical protein
MNTNKPQEFSMRQLFSFVICVMLSSALHGMEMVVNNDNYCTNALLSKNKDNFARDAIIVNCLSNGDHDTYRIIAMLSKTHNAIVENNYRPIKKRIENYIQSNYTVPPVIAGHASWNKDFSRCAWVTYDLDPTLYKDLELTLVGAVNNEVVVMCASWKNFYFPTFEDNIRPFFNKDGRACFYGYGLTVNSYRNQALNVEYSISLDGEAEYYKCSFLTVAPEKEGNDNAVYGGSYISDFPVLLKAWLQSKIVRISESCNACNSKVYNINGVTLPDDYKFFKKYEGWMNYCDQQESSLMNSVVKSYDFLPYELRRFIDAKYAKQQQEKNNKTLEEK